VPRVELQAAGKAVTLEADEISVKDLGKIAVDLWSKIEFPTDRRQPFGVSMPSDSQADDSLRYDQFTEPDGRMGAVR
jgi:hypothetical protein